MSRSLRHPFLVAALALALLLLGLFRLRPEADFERSRARGSALFHGEEPIFAKMFGFELTLPPESIFCANCHAESGSSGALEADFAPTLTRTYLAERRVRRTGSPTSYDEQTFCHLLHTGVRPNGTVVAPAMPRFRLTTTDCSALWDYLLTH